MIDKIEARDPLPEDYVAEPCGRGGADICVSDMHGTFLGQFGDLQLAQIAVNMDMDNKQKNRKMWYKKSDGTLELALGFDGL